VPGGAIALDKALTQDGVHGMQVDHIERRVELLRLGKGALQPVAARLAFVEFSADQLRDERTVADAQTHADEGRGDLGVEQGVRAIGQERRHGFEIFAGAVHHRDHGVIGECRTEYVTERERHRVDQGVAALVGQLEQGELRVEGVAPHELGVESDDGGRADGGQPGGQIVVVVDPRCGGSEVARCHSCFLVHAWRACDVRVALPHAIL